MYRAIVGSAITLSLFAGVAGAQPMDIEVTIESLSPSNGVAFSPFTLAFHDGTYDGFDAGNAAGTGIQKIAEFGDGTDYLTDFNGSQSDGVSGTLIATNGGFGPGIFLPGASGSMTFTLDPTNNRYMNFGAMVVPSNDRFFGNDDPMAVELFDAGGNFVGQSVMLYGRDIWDAGTEVDGPFGAAFIVGQDAGDHVDQNGVIETNYDFSVYDGSMTPAGYTFSDLPTMDGALARISFRVVPAPSSLALLGLGGLAATRRRRG